MSPLGRGLKFPRFFSSRIFLLINLFFLFFLFFSLAREWTNNYAVQQEIAKLTAEQAALEAENLDLTAIMSAVQTETYIEQEARIKLGLAKPGEKVVIFSEQDQQVAKIPDGQFDKGNISDQSIKAWEKLANPRKWWYYFFNSNKFDLIKVYGNPSS